MKPTRRAVPAAEIIKATKPFKGNGALQSPYRSQSFVEIVDALDKPEDWLINGLLPRHGLALLYGAKKSFKSFTVLDLALAIGRGALWADHETKRGTVVYVAGEGAHGLRKRIKGWHRVWGVRDVRFFLIPARFDLGSADNSALQALIAEIRRLVGADGPVLIIIDTLTRMLLAGDESGEGMQCFVNHAEALAEEFNCLVLAVHHQGWNALHARGHSSLPAAVVSSWRVTKWKSGLGCDVLIEDAKDSDSGDIYRIALKSVEVGDASTLIVESIEHGEPLDDEPPTTKRAKAPPTFAAMMTSLEIALHRHGIELQLPDDGPRVKAVNLDYLRACYYQKRAELTEDSRRTTFNRHLGDGLDREVLVSREINGTVFVWRGSKP